MDRQSFKNTFRPTIGLSTDNRLALTLRNIEIHQQRPPKVTYSDVHIVTTSYSINENTLFNVNASCVIGVHLRCKRVPLIYSQLTCSVPYATECGTADIVCMRWLDKLNIWKLNAVCVIWLKRKFDIFPIAGISFRCRTCWDINPFFLIGVWTVDYHISPPRASMTFIVFMVCCL